jgi:hypothetical protein
LINGTYFENIDDENDVLDGEDPALSDLSSSEPDTP